MILPSTAPDKIIKQIHDSLQSCRVMMIIHIITILLLAGGVFSSMPVRGSISMIHDNTMSIDLRVSILSDSDDLDELIEKLRKMEEPRIHMIIDLGRKVIEINGETDFEQDYFKVGNNIENMFRRIVDEVTFMQEYDNSYKRLAHQNLNAYEILRHGIVSQDHQNSMNNKNDFVLSWMISNPEFAMEMERLISRNELSLEYAKSIEYVLLWLIKLFDLKWRQLYDDFDYISRWRFLNLQRQVELFLENLILDNQSRKSKDDKYILEKRNDNVLNTKKLKDEKTTLTKQNKENLRANKTEISTNKSLENISSKNTMNQEVKYIENNTKNLTTITPIDQEFTFDTSTDVKDISVINDTFSSKTESSRDKDITKNKTFSKSEEVIDIHDKHMNDGKRFSQLENISSLPNENITSTLQEIDQRKHAETNVTLQGPSRNKIDIRKTPSRRTLLAPSNKNKKQKNRHKSTEYMSDKHHYFNDRMKIKSDSASAIDEILEAVDEVFPTDKPVEKRSSKGSNTFF